MELSLTQLNERFTKPLLELLQEGYLLRPTKKAEYGQGVLLEKGEEKFALVRHATIADENKEYSATRHDIVLIRLTEEIELRDFEEGTLYLMEDYRIGKKRFLSPIVKTYDTYYSIHFPNLSYWESGVIRYYDNKKEATKIAEKRYYRKQWAEFKEAGVLFTFKFDKTPWKGLRRNVTVEVTKRHHILTNQNGKKTYADKTSNYGDLVRA